jgi:DAP10 membrane protein
MSAEDTDERRGGYAGGCYKDGEAVCVVREETYCDDGTWVAAHFLRGYSGEPLRYCTGEIANVVIGRCGTTGPCSNLSDRCDDPSAFIEYDPTCTIPTDLKDMSRTVYGKCGDRCVWSDQDCVGGESYVKWADECTSEYVEIGACWAGYAFCAVSVESCVQQNMPAEPFFTHQELFEQVGAKCFLTDIPEPPSSPPVQNTAPAPSSAPIARPSSSAAFTSEGNTSGAGGLSTGGIAGIVASAAVVTGLLVGYVAYKMGVRSSVNDKGTTTTEQRTRPMTAVEASEQIQVEEDEDLSVY